MSSVKKGPKPLKEYYKYKVPYTSKKTGKTVYYEYERKSKYKSRRRTEKDYIVDANGNLNQEVYDEILNAFNVTTPQGQMVKNNFEVEVAKRVKNKEAMKTSFIDANKYSTSNKVSRYLRNMGYTEQDALDLLKSMGAKGVTMKYLLDSSHWSSTGFTDAEGVFFLARVNYTGNIFKKV